MDEYSLLAAVLNAGMDVHVHAMDNLRLEHSSLVSDHVRAQEAAAGISIFKIRELPHNLTN
jgi:hypothetical protein